MALTIPQENTGLSLPYRALWRTKYILLTFMGPADQHGMKDPRFQMRAQRWAKVQAARAEKGLAPLDPPAA